MNVLFLTKYTSKAASSKYRTLQYLPYLEEMGVSCTISSLFADDYLKSLRQHKNRGIVILKSLLKRISVIFLQANKFDLIIIEKELIPYFPAIFERYLSLIKTGYVLDYDDAVYHHYDENKNSVIRLLLKNKIPTAIKKSSGIIVGSDYILEYVKRFKSDNVYFLPTVINANNYSIKISDNTNFIIGWIGSVTTSKNIVMINNSLENFCNEYNATVRLVGFDEELGSSLTFPHEIINWVEGKEPDEIKNFDVGIMPLIDSSFNRGKCGFKIIQYHGCALPVIASPVGINKKIITHGTNGFLAKTDDEWYQYLEMLYIDRSLCHSMGAQGRKKIENEYDLDQTKVEYFKIIKSFY